MQDGFSAGPWTTSLGSLQLGGFLMKNFNTFLTILMTLVFCTSAFAKSKNDDRKIDVKKARSIIWIDSEEDSADSGDVKDLRRRVNRLEKAVRQLQDRIFDLEAEQDSPKEPEEYTCILESNFGDVLTATAKTENKARMDVYLQCRKEHDIPSMCPKEKITCKL
jgi:hypothetical protein